MNKISENYVRIASKICPVCGIKHTNSNEILLHKQLREIPEDKTCTGYGLCENDQQKFDDGFIALIAVNNTPKNGETIKQQDADRTGEMAHLKRSVFREIFNVPISDDLEYAFVEPKILQILKNMQQKS